MIRWARECMGVTITPHYHAMVRAYDGNTEQPNKVWAFAGRRGPYKKLNTAQEACEYNFKIWTAAVQVAKGEFKGRADRLRAMDGRARAGSGVSRGRLFHNVPVWVRNHDAAALRTIIATIFPCKGKSNDPDDQPGVLETSESCSQDELSVDGTPTIQTGGPALSAVVADEFETPCEVSDSPSTGSRSRRKTTSAKGAKAPATGPKKPSKRSTTKKSKSTESPPSSTPEPSPPKPKRSRSSPKKKSKPSNGSE